MPRCTPAGADGAYVIAGLASAAHRVQASASGFYPASRGATVGLGPGERRTVDVELMAGGVVLRGLVVGVEGAAIVGAWVTSDGSRSDRASPEAAARSGADGGFVLWVRPGIHSVVADAAGHSQTTVEVDTGTAPARIVLVPEAVLAGTVIDARSGAPLAGARVEAIVDGAKGPTRAAGLTYTDAAGAYRVTRLSPGAYRLLARRGER